MMANNSRTKNSILNSVFGIISYILIMAATMTSRIAFARYLGEELLGLNSLYTSILQILQISELGISNAIIIFLYDPVKKQDMETTKAILSLYKRIYRIFACTLMVLGCAVLFLILPHIVDVKTVDMQTVQVYFFLYLTGIVCSYLFAYNKSVFYAEQKNRVISIVDSSIKVVVAILQVLIIFEFKNYFAFLIIMALGNLSENLICHFAVRKEHSYLHDRFNRELTKDEKNKILSLIKPIFIVRIADKVLSQSDSLIINGMIDIVTLGMYTNYHTIFNACLGLFNPIGAALTSSYGNLAVDAPAGKKYSAYKKSYPILHFFTVILCAFFMVYIQDFIMIAYGRNYILSDLFVVLMTLYLYLSLVTTIYYSYQNAMGLHKLDQKQMVLRIPFNIIVSIVLAKICGIEGIIIGTILSILFFSIMFKGAYIFSRVFDISRKNYYIRTIRDALLTGLLFTILFALTKLYVIEGIGQFVVKVLVMGGTVIASTTALLSIDSEFRGSLRAMTKFIVKNTLKGFQKLL